jgi:long-chain acyl-CoA synthetase
VINCAGLVDFNPDVRDAVASNVDGALRVAEFARACDHAALMHVSTCYVAGSREGFVPEEVRIGTSPNGTPIDARVEYAKLQEIVAEVRRENDDPTTEAELRDHVLERVRDRGVAADEKRIADMVARLKRKRLREMMALAGTDRAKALGWPNTYTYTKALAELMLVAQAAELPYAIFRPAIVESAMAFPFAGWNEGFNTSGPLVYLAGTWFRHVPARAGNPLDVIPVDQVCNAIFTVGAALLKREHEQVYQCGSSDRNFLPIDRLTELSALGHRRHLRKTGADKVEKLVLSRWDARASDRDHLLDMANIRAAVAQVTRYLRHGLPEKIPSEVREWADDLAGTGDNTQRKLRQIEEVLDLFMPFTYDHYCVFECRAISRHDVVEDEFRFSPESIEWRSYWLDVHMPGLRRWCFPQYENKEREKYVPAAPFRLLEADPPAQKEAG